jgi:anaerobic selenocysteine-containing dehydrogenase
MPDRPPPLWRRPQSSRPLQVVGFIGTRVSDPVRGPQVRMRPQEAQERMLVEGELVLIEGPRRQQLAELVLDEALPRGGVVVRDIAGVAPSELVYVMKPDLDAPPEVGRLA